MTGIEQRANHAIYVILRIMYEAKKTNRELALGLITRLIDLETERDSAAGLLLYARDKDTNQPLDWRPLVRELIATKAK